MDSILILSDLVCVGMVLTHGHRIATVHVTLGQNHVHRQLSKVCLTIDLVIYTV